MGRVIAIANHKGGSGKTTTTQCLAESLRKLGKTVWEVNADPMRDPDLMAIEMGNCEHGISSEILRTRIDAKRDEFDFSLIDCPSSLGLLTVNALVAADEVIIPIRCDHKAMEKLSELMAEIRIVQSTRNRGLKIKGILLTMVNPSLQTTLVIYSDMKKLFGDLLFGTVIRKEHKEDYDVLASEIL